MAFWLTAYLIGAFGTAAIASLSGPVVAEITKANRRQQIAVGISIIMISLLWPLAWLGVIIGKASARSKV